MILLTRFNGPVFALNPDLIERADHTPDTVITLVDGTKYVVAESLDELIRLVRLHRASVLADAEMLITGQGPGGPPAGGTAEEQAGERPLAPVLEPVRGENDRRSGTSPAPLGPVPEPPSDVIPLHRRGH